MSPALTPREHEVLRLLVEGRTNREIAARLCLSEGTVEQHLAHLYRKLGVHNRTEAARAFWTAQDAKDVGDPI
jgi:DNA-binding NarL/FixJ family response regulator